MKPRAAIASKGRDAIRGKTFIFTLQSGWMQGGVNSLPGAPLAVCNSLKMAYCYSMPLNARDIHPADEGLSRGPRGMRYPPRCFLRFAGAREHRLCSEAGYWAPGNGWMCRVCARSVPRAGDLPLPVVLGKYSLFKALATYIYRKHFVLRYLKPRYLKTRYLSGSLGDAWAGMDNAGLRSVHDSQLQVSGFDPNRTQIGFRRKTLITSGIL